MRAKRIRMSFEAAVIWCVKNNNPQCIEGIPTRNYRIVNVLVDTERRIIEFMVEHKGFPNIPEAGTVPELTPTFRERRKRA